MTPSDSPLTNNPTDVASEPSPLHELSWFPAIILSIIVTLIWCKWSSSLVEIGPNAIDDLIITVSGFATAYGCLIGFGTQGRRPYTILFYIPYAIFFAALLCLISRDETVLIIAFFGAPLLLLPSRRQLGILSISVRLSIIAVIGVWGMSLARLGVLRSTEIIISLPGITMYLPMFIGIASGWAFRRLSTFHSSPGQRRVIVRLFPRQFSIMSLFALTTAFAIGTWFATQLHFSPTGWLEIAFWTLLGDVIAILVCRFLTAPSPSPTKP
jgi:hypothetical protein